MASSQKWHNLCLSCLNLKDKVTIIENNPKILSLCARWADRVLDGGGGGTKLPMLQKTNTSIPDYGLCGNMVSFLAGA